MADGPQVVEDHIKNAKYMAPEPEPAPPATMWPDQTSQYAYKAPLENGHNYYTADDSPQHYKGNDIRQHATVCGIRRRTFWILVVCAFLVVGVTIGGSVGGSLAVQNSKSNSQPATTGETSPLPSPAFTPSPIQSALSATNAPSSAASSIPTGAAYLPTRFSDVPLINITCPSEVYDPSAAPNVADQYRYNCRNNWNMAATANPDILGLTAYSLEQCINACTQYNTMPNTPKEKCGAVVLADDLKFRFESGNGANCWLKPNSQGGVTTKGYSAAIVIT